jgi:hypothetical protein
MHLSRYTPTYIFVLSCQNLRVPRSVCRARCTAYEGIILLHPKFKPAVPRREGATKSGLPLTASTFAIIRFGDQILELEHENNW